MKTQCWREKKKKKLINIPMESARVERGAVTIEAVKE